MFVCIGITRHFNSHIGIKRHFNSHIGIKRYFNSHIGIKRHFNSHIGIERHLNSHILDVSDVDRAERQKLARKRTCRNWVLLSGDFYLLYATEGKAATYF